MRIHMLCKGQPLWEKTIIFAANCSWQAGPYLAERMKIDDFAVWERVFAAEEDDQIIGFAVFSEKDGLPAEYTCTPFVSLVFVDEAYRGNRISEKLIKCALDYAKTLGCQTVYLKSEHRGLYEKYGFEKLGEFEPVSGPADQLFQIRL